MILFTAVADASERSREGDSRWLDAAVEALSFTDGWGQSEMRHTLLAIGQDYIIEPGERDTIGIAVAQVPERVELRDGTLQPRELAMASRLWLGSGSARGRRRRRGQLRPR